MLRVHDNRVVTGRDGTVWRIATRARDASDHPEADPLIVELVQPDGRARKARSVDTEFAAKVVSDIFEELVNRGKVRPRT